MGLRWVTYCTCLCWFLGLGSQVTADSGRKLVECPVITVDAFEVNIIFSPEQDWNKNGRKVQVMKPSFAQIIFWKWTPRDHDYYKDIFKRPPHMGWTSHGWMTYKWTKDENDEKNGLDGEKSNQTLPYKNYHDGYWYINVRENHILAYKVRSKILMGMNELPSGHRCTFTDYDPEARDRSFRNIPDKYKEPKPQDLYKAIMKARKARAEGRQEQQGPPEPVVDLTEGYQQFRRILGR